MRAELQFTALGTPWNIICDADLPDDGMRALERRIRARLEDFERTYSRFRADSLVSHIKTRACAGMEDHYVVADTDRLPFRSVMFPPDAEGLFAIADALHVASDGRIDPCVGADLETLGYDADLRFTVGGGAGDAGAAIEPSSWGHLGAEHRPIWAQLRAGAGPRELRIPAGSTPPSLDFGACGKGYAVDLVAGLLEVAGVQGYVIDASGDLRARSFDSALPRSAQDDREGIRHSAQDDRSTAPRPTQDDRLTIRPPSRSGGEEDSPHPGTSNTAPCRPERAQRVEGPQAPGPLRIALESPFDPSQAVGVAAVADGSFCASGVTRRHWHDATSGMELHHILDAISGRPTRGILASWTYVGTNPDTGTGGTPSGDESLADGGADVAPGPLTDGPAGTANPSHADIAKTAGATEDIMRADGRNTVSSGAQDDAGTAEPTAWDGAALASHYPTAVADGLATALFSCDPARLRDFFPYEFALVRSDGGAQGSAGFPGGMFLA